MVTDYYERAGLTPYLEKLGFNLVGYGCTTCIGNSGPLIPEVSAAVNEKDLAVAAVLSGNRNFEGRINPDIKLNYLASPPLVVAYAIAGSMDVDLLTEPLGQDTDGQRRVPEGHLADAGRGRGDRRAARSPPRCSPTDYADVFAGDDQWRSLSTPEGATFAWADDSTYVRKPPYFEGMPQEPAPVDGHPRRARARQARRLGDDGPHLAGRRDQAGLARRHVPDGARCRAARLQLLRLAPRQPRGHGARHVRQHPAAQPAGARHRGRLHHANFAGDGEVTTIYEASEAYADAGTPLVILAGKEYGSGSSRDWAAKGTALLGARAVIAESYERIHRSNLIGMGVLPLQYPEGENAESLGLSGEETFEITGVEAMNDGERRPPSRSRRPGMATTSSSTRWSASTPRASSATTGTAGSCTTCCAASATADARDASVDVGGAGRGDPAAPVPEACGDVARPLSSSWSGGSARSSRRPPGRPSWASRLGCPGRRTTL